MGRKCKDVVLSVVGHIDKFPVGKKGLTSWQKKSTVIWAKKPNWQTRLFPFKSWQNILSNTPELAN